MCTPQEADGQRGVKERRASRLFPTRRAATAWAKARADKVYIHKADGTVARVIDFSRDPLEALIARAPWHSKVFEADHAASLTSPATANSTT
jgi:hypothetical protein